jgi:pyrimidine operon attenuation protein/uracil phosphoribosyltransferase
MKRQILDQDKIDKILSRISLEILERNQEPASLFVVGIKKRGDILAERIAKKIEKLEKIKVGISSIDITFYRDDVELKAYKFVGQNEIQFDITDKNVILVDDVLFTGRTIRAAIDVLVDAGRPRSIQLAVLIDRGGREFPIQPDYVGKQVQTDKDSEVSVNIKEIDGQDKVIISL